MSEQNIYEGFWTDYSRAPADRATLTLSSSNGRVFIAFVSSPPHYLRKLLAC